MRFSCPVGIGWTGLLISISLNVVQTGSLHVYAWARRENNQRSRLGCDCTSHSYCVALVLLHFAGGRSPRLLERARTRGLSCFLVEFPFTSWSNTMARPISELLSDMSVHAKHAEDEIAQARRESHDRVVARRE